LRFPRFGSAVNTLVIATKQLSKPARLFFFIAIESDYYFSTPSCCLRRVFVATTNSRRRRRYNPPKLTAAVHCLPFATLTTLWFGSCCNIYKNQILKLKNLFLQNIDEFCKIYF
jgi:hypothetical protein